MRMNISLDSKLESVKTNSNEIKYNPIYRGGSQLSDKRHTVYNTETDTYRGVGRNIRTN